ncbi:alginate lyase family protein [uncultured Cloacibacillus sp.]|uniref:heparinase II/III family protein n=1 Tax=uncultured Cloacibacillus sp. TaxID=889794 RepID=UPI0026DBD7E2|nr:alginate lyase family protein [uncultured Cloacibacillus sp.]
MTTNKAMLFLHTIKYLRGRQIVGQILKPFVMRRKCRINKKAPSEIYPIKTLIPCLDLNVAYLSRFNVDEIMRNIFTLLSETHHLDLKKWEIDAAPLWQFNMHYFEYLIALAARYTKTHDSKYYEKIKELILTWIDVHPIGQGAAWHPYTISMRIPNWMITFDILGDIFTNDASFKKKVVSNIYAQYNVLLKRKETWQLGNHYFENLKTIVLCSLLFQESKITQKYVRLLMKEIREEVLPDGVHFELSLMYHKIIMEDLLRVAYWLHQVKMPEEAAVNDVLHRMATAIYSLEYGIGRTPLFNDSGEGVAKATKTILKGVEEFTNSKAEHKTCFLDSGYYKLYSNNCAMIFDAGKIGPDYMPGHGHCDCLSFEMSLNNRPLFVNSGTYKYQCAERGYFRSTKAHNTLVICGHEQSECWGEHRAARRLHDLNVQYAPEHISASYINYLGDTHTRELSIFTDRLQVLDSVVTSAQGRIQSYLHIAPQFYVKVTGTGAEVWLEESKVCDIQPILCSYKVHQNAELSLYSPAFGVLDHGTCLEFNWDADTNQHGYKVYINGGLYND